MERRISFSDGEFYHVYNRGVDKRTVFSTRADYNRFVALLYLMNDTGPSRSANLLRSKSLGEILAQPRKSPLVAVGAYCLMPNHFHLLMTPIEKDGISKFMLRLQTAYSMYFNIRNDRSGALFQGAFKAQHVESDTHFQYLYAYIHLNPASLFDAGWKNGAVSSVPAMKKFLDTYPFSSRGEYVSGKADARGDR
jgi:putative transposase